MENKILATNHLFPIEIDYFINLTKEDSSISDNTREAIINKLNCLKDNYSVDPDLTMSCLMNNFHVEAGGIYFEYYPMDESVEIIDSDTGEYTLNSCLSKNFNEMIDEDNCGEIGEKISERVRFCSLCGRPMDNGFTDEDVYICSDSEFYLYMDKLYGLSNWRGSDENELKKYEANYMYRDDEDGEWKPSGWYYTEWYDGSY